MNRACPVVAIDGVTNILIPYYVVKPATHLKIEHPYISYRGAESPDDLQSLDLQIQATGLDA